MAISHLNNACINVSSSWPAKRSWRAYCSHSGCKHGDMTSNPSWQTFDRKVRILGSVCCLFHATSHELPMLRSEFGRIESKINIYASLTENWRYHPLPGEYIPIYLAYFVYRAQTVVLSPCLRCVFCSYIACNKQFHYSWICHDANICRVN